MWNSLFWHADSEFFDKEMAEHHTKAWKALQKATRLGRVSQGDLDLLKQATELLYVHRQPESPELTVLAYRQVALEDASWRQTMYREDVPYLTFTPHQRLQTAWTRHINQPELFYPDRLIKLRELAAEDPEITLEKLEEEAIKAIARDAKNDAMVEKQKLQIAQGKHKGRGPRKMTVAKANKPRVSAHVDKSSPLYGFQVGLSKSSKINWVVQEVRHRLVQRCLKPKFLDPCSLGPSIRGRREVSHFLEEPSGPRTSF